MALTKQQKLDAYKTMMVIRRFEEKCAELYAAGDIGGFLHLYIGQEAIAIAGAYARKESDNVITAYRDHGIALAAGMDPKNVMAEMLGRSTGTSKGMGGSMHLADKDKRFWGGWAIVGGHLPLAAGLAWADQYLGRDGVTMALMGDGSTNIGYFHESVNLSAVWKLPVVWVVENNQYGMGTAVDRASAVNMIEKGKGYGLPTAKLDGMDLINLYDGFSKALKHCRAGKGAYFIEAETYRFRGHSMGDPERYRPSEEVESRKQDDPIARWAGVLMGDDLATQAELEQMENAADDIIADAVEFARNSPLPGPEVYDYVYAD